MNTTKRFTNKNQCEDAKDTLRKYLKQTPTVTRLHMVKKSKSTSYLSIGEYPNYDLKENANVKTKPELNAAWQLAEYTTIHSSDSSESLEMIPTFDNIKPGPKKFTNKPTIAPLRKKGVKTGKAVMPSSPKNRLAHLLKKSPPCINFNNIIMVDAKTFASKRHKKSTVKTPKRLYGGLEATDTRFHVGPPSEKMPPPPSQPLIKRIRSSTRTYCVPLCSPPTVILGMGTEYSYRMHQQRALHHQFLQKKQQQQYQHLMQTRRTRRSRTPLPPPQRPLQLYRVPTEPYLKGNVRYCGNYYYV
ncbi:uncharacterized protein LOC115634448 [Scaptodrosophila lebanonensis]|uniref:Uncharacterized protein LOC115634448 n=1 Tax=Drosophila lebanonensis TaxID=7225 RepID=A0A6J2UKM1_DROLE|nr:uncharacterized protein LOC115634448 [Scaptodrosophila lebanonensis]